MAVTPSVASTTTGSPRRRAFQDLSLLDYLDSPPVQEALAGLRRLRPSHPYCARCLGGPSRPYAFLKGLGAVAYFGVLGAMLRRVGA